ncbi:TIGR02996 domain-containing protein [Gemmata sp. G18]|uniref:TIGR02996 domain-containing protein n=1 Tax=Gemmata palustris TaxID=2822762 RepID=A0ABS5BVD7_9BACT|nr:TIGR02996 domain-containing protein [Gemmata palustris]MBP3957706.1 TIGR02996 domain-containing protein [Gemmata palustris]
MTIEENALLAAIAAEPVEDVHRLAYADWLDENGRHERAEFIRVQCERAVLERPARLFSWHDPECRRNAGRHRRLFEWRGDCQRCAELRAYHSGLEQLKTRIKVLRERERG